jgi:hypothetical protein
MVRTHHGILHYEIASAPDEIRYPVYPEKTGGGAARTAMHQNCAACVAQKTHEGKILTKNNRIRSKSHAAGTAP